MTAPGSRRGIRTIFADPYGGAGRLVMYASGATIVLVCAITALSVGDWRWPLFAWGIGDGILSALMYQLTLKLLPTLLHAPAERTAQAQPRLDQMRRVLVPLLLSIGLGIGVLASGIASAWPDILLAAGIVVFQVMVPAALLRILRRRMPNPRSA